MTSKVHEKLLIECLQQLADKSMQDRYWVHGDDQHMSSFVEAVCGVFDDAGLTDALESGSFRAAYSDEAWAAAQTLDKALDRVPDGLAPQALIDHPTMDEVRRRAADLLAIVEARAERWKRGQVRQSVYPRLKALHSPDVPDLQSFTPDDPERFGILVQMIVGPATEPGEESFDVVVCTATWLDEHFADDPAIPLRHYLLVHDFDYAQLERSLKKLLKACDGHSWNEVAAKVGRIGRWEFEDYTP